MQTENTAARKSASYLEQQSIFTKIKGSTSK